MEFGDSKKEIVASIRPVADFSERCQAWNLVYRKYLESGFISCHSSGLYLSLLDLLPLTSCWVAVMADKIIGTMSLVINTTSGLPGGLPYELDLRRLGVDGRIVGEFTKLAVEEGFVSNNIAAELMAVMICEGLEKQIDDLICIVHPRHAKAWSHIFGWRYIGETRSHSGVNNKPGAMLHLDLKRIPRNFEGLPMRGQKLLRNARENIKNSRPVYRPSGCEAATILVQSPKLYTNSSFAHRTGVERYYPWASYLIKTLLNPSLNLLKARIENANQSSRPERDRSIVFPNEASRRLILSGQVKKVLTNYDQLLFPEDPIVYFLSNNSKECCLIKEVLESNGMIIISKEREADVLDPLQNNICDMVITTLPHQDQEIGRVSTYIRERDALLGSHTPIVNLLDVFDHSETSLIIQNFFALSNLKLSCLKELSNLILEITTAFENEHEISAVGTPEIKPFRLVVNS